jgi:carbamoyltransferase
MYILGIWDGHDCGAALIKGDKVIAAVNEERFTKQKLEIGFPKRSIRCCLDIAGIRPEAVKHIAVNTADIAKTLTRYFPKIKQSYYLFRRRKVKPSFVNLRREFKYKVTELKANRLTKHLTLSWYKKELFSLGFKNFCLHLVEHHTAHAAAAGFTSGFKRAIVITLDGVGDGLSGTINVLEAGKLRRLSNLPARASLGIFFEQATNLLGMRELEDEGKLMALSDYSYKIQDKDNPLLKLFNVKGLEITTGYSTWKRYRLLQELAWMTPSEDFAYMVQKTLERKALELFTNAINSTGIKNVAWAGGVASNIKNNMSLREHSGLEGWYVFPHMGDGGLALGCALYAAHKLQGTSSFDFPDAYLGPEYSEEHIKQVLKQHPELRFSLEKDIAKRAADAICAGEIVMWFQGRMEYGPRALGNRSILASAYSLDVKNTLNVNLKRRDWFQPFCPSILQEDAPALLEGIKQRDPYMTMGYSANEEGIRKIVAVLNVDGSARPQMLAYENPLYRKLLTYIKQKTGYGIVLNTSFNIHGDPIVNTPEDAISAMLKGGAKYLCLGDFWVECKQAKPSS